MKQETPKNGKLSKKNGEIAPANGIRRGCFRKIRSVKNLLKNLKE